MVLTSVTPGVLRSCGRITQSCRVRKVFRRPFRAVWLCRAFFRLDRVHKDFAKARGDRTKFRLDPLRQLAAHRKQALIDQLTREIDVGAVFEDDGDLA
jgi:hypothetical protein